LVIVDLRSGTLNMPIQRLNFGIFSNNKLFNSFESIDWGEASAKYKPFKIYSAIIENCMESGVTMN
jgi:hypothetical protein